MELIGLMLIPVVTVASYFLFKKTGVKRYVAANLCLLVFFLAGVVHAHLSGISAPGCSDCGLIYIYLTPFIVVLYAFVLAVNIAALVHWFKNRKLSR